MHIGTGVATALTLAPIALAIPFKMKQRTGIGNYKLDVANMFSNIATTMYSIYRYYFFNPYNIKPAIVIAGIPLGTVEEISHAMSDRILKYRSTGGIFLAHQEGGEVSLRVQGKAIGKNRYMFLTMMDILFLYGSGKNIDLFADAIKDRGLFEHVDTETGLGARTSPWKEFHEYNMDMGREEKHLTFPIITKSKVYNNMYIETWEFKESVEKGMDVINYTIFFRKYIPHFPYTYKSMQNAKGKEVYYYSEDQSEGIVKKMRMFDVCSDLLFSTSMIFYRFFQYVAGNSIETTIAHISGLEINTSLLGVNYASKKLEEIYDINYDLQGLSIPQKEELMLID